MWAWVADLADRPPQPILRRPTAVTGRNKSTVLNQTAAERLSCIASNSRCNSSASPVDADSTTQSTPALRKSVRAGFESSAESSFRRLRSGPRRANRPDLHPLQLQPTSRCGPGRRRAGARGHVPSFHMKGEIAAQRALRGRYEACTESRAAGPIACRHFSGSVQPDHAGTKKQKHEAVLGKTCFPERRCAERAAGPIGIGAKSP